MNIMSNVPPMLPSVYDPSQLQQPTATNSSASSSSTNLSPGIIIISLLLILAVALCLLFRYCHRLLYFLSRRGSSVHSFSPPGGDAAVQSLIDSLPFFTFSSLTRGSFTTTLSSAVVEADCAICLSRFVSRDTLRLLPLCCHAFHSQCIDTWLSSGHKTCPLCRSNVYTSATLPAASISCPPTSSASRNVSFRLEIGSVSRHHNDSTSNGRRSYSIGSFDYVVETETEVTVADRHRRSVSDKEDGISNNPDIANLDSDGRNTIAGALGGGSRSWLEECMDRLSSRTASFRSSRSFFTGSSGRSEVTGVGEWDIEAIRVSEEINELFRRASGV